ncbi:MAG: FAD binding domain-containing protein, partial [Spirochaetaceae bacterium]|nr:FAD binding domain-containing protein [Spirochaetaceae bacterium]
HGGTQCGFCTPGIVVSLYGLLLDDAKGLSLEDVKYALSGHLCRCTGYRSLKDCAETLDRRFGSRLNGTGGADGVSGANLTRRVAVMASAGALPDYFTTIPERLRDLRGESHAPEPEAEPEVRIAGGTDLYVQQGGEEIPDRRVEVLNRRPALKGIRVRDGEFRVGALTTFEEFGADQQVTESIPRIGAFNHLIASWQIRNRATLSGNIVNASPIGDFTALLLALDARVVLDDGGSRRSVSLKDFYHGYKQMDLRPGELVTEVAFADPADSRVNFEKVSKRTCLDIASVNSACAIRCIGDTIIDAHVSLGGVAPIPLYLHETSQALRGRNLDQEAAWDALRLSQQEIAPITDVRGSAEYKRLLARQLLIAHFVTLFPERFAAEAFYAGGLS